MVDWLPIVYFYFYFYLYLYIPFFCRIAAFASPSPHSTAAEFAAIVGPKWDTQIKPCNLNRTLYILKFSFQCNALALLIAIQKYYIFFLISVYNTIWIVNIYFVHLFATTGTDIKKTTTTTKKYKMKKIIYRDIGWICGMCGSRSKAHFAEFIFEKKKKQTI